MGIKYIFLEQLSTYRNLHCSQREYIYNKSDNFLDKFKIF